MTLLILAAVSVFCGLLLYGIRYQRNSVRWIILLVATGIGVIVLMFFADKR